MATNSTPLLLTQYSSISPTSKAAAGVITLAKTTKINFSGITQGGQESVFTIGAWVRANAACGKGIPSKSASTYDIFTNGQVHLSWNNQGELAGGFGAYSSKSKTWISSDYSCADGNWHFVALSYQQTSTNGGGTLNLFVDNCLVNTATIAATDLKPAKATALTLYPAVKLTTTQRIDMSVFMILSTFEEAESITNPMMWNQPSTSSSSGKSMVACFDFANGTAVDTSGNKAKIVIGSQNWNTPCLQLKNGAQASIPTTTAIAPGAKGDFSVMGWISFTGTQKGTICLFNSKMNDGSKLWIGLTCTTDAKKKTVYQITLHYSSSAKGTKPVVYTSAKFTYTTWAHVAVTYSSKAATLSFYQNGTLLKAFTKVTNPWPTTSSSKSILIGSAKIASAIQALNFWSVALTAAQIVSTVNSGDPIGVSNCTAGFDFEIVGAGGTLDSIGGTGIGITIPKKKGSVAELVSPVVVKKTTAVAARKVVVRKADKNAPKIMTSNDYHALAEKLGIDTKAQPTAAMKADPAFKACTDWYEGLLKTVKPALANRMRERFHRNLSISKQLSEKAPDVGRFVHETVGGKITLKYGTAKGYINIPGVLQNADSSVGELVKLCIGVGSNILAVFLDIVGLAPLVKAVGRTLGKMTTVTLTNVASAVAKAFKKTASVVEQSASALIEYLTALSLWGSISSVVWSIIDELRWWEIGLAFVSLIGTIAGIVASGGAALVIKLGNLIMNLYNLVNSIIALVNYLSSGNTATA